MPKAYVIVTEAVTDADKMGEYAGAAVPTVIGSGGSVAIAGPPESVLEGEWHGNQTVMLEFPSVEAAHAWYNSPDYQAIVGLRHEASQSNFAIFEAFG